MMAYKRKYCKGGKITSLDELAKQKFVYCYDKILHNGWFGSWQFSFAKRMIDRGVIFYAVKKED